MPYFFKTNDLTATRRSMLAPEGRMACRGTFLTRLAALAAYPDWGRVSDLVSFSALVVLFACAFAALSPDARAQATESSSPTAAPAAAQDPGLLASLKAPKAGVAFSYFDDAWHKEGVGYWTIASLGSKGLRQGAPGAVPYIDLDFGVAGASFRDVRLFLPVMLHPANLAEPILRRLSPGGRLATIEIPSWLELGPALRYCPDKPVNKQRLMEDVAFLAAYKFGGNP